MSMTFDKKNTGNSETGGQPPADRAKPRDASSLNIHDLGIDVDVAAEEFVELDAPDDVDRGIERLIRSAGVTPPKRATPSASVTPISAAGMPEAANGQSTEQAVSAMPSPAIKVTDPEIAEQVEIADASSRIR